MTKDEALEQAREWANHPMVGGITIYVLRRGNQYKVSSIFHKGWKLAEMVAPVTVGLTTEVTQ